MIKMEKELVGGVRAGGAVRRWVYYTFRGTHFEEKMEFISKVFMCVDSCSVDAALIYAI
jgi:hypothetical protein